MAVISECPAPAAVLVIAKFYSWCEQFEETIQCSETNHNELLVMQQ